MKVTLKSLKNKIEGEVLETKAHRNAVLNEQALRNIKGGFPPTGPGYTVSMCPSADDSVD